jgi:hypothetical protein
MTQEIHHPNQNVLGSPSSQPYRLSCPFCSCGSKVNFIDGVDKSIFLCGYGIDSGAILISTCKAHIDFDIGEIE